MVAKSAKTQRERIALALAALAIFATRLPWLGAGYGSDPDGYRVVLAARAIAHSGQYEASRLPGFPVYEYLTGLFAQAAPWVSNAVTALLSAVAFLLFALILRHFQVRLALLIAVGFAMTPVIYINSCCTMDYVSALTLMLGATYALLRGRPALAGILLGLATGCRITSGLLGPALCLWLWLTAARRVALRQGLILGTISLLVAALCYLPVYRRYGIGFFSFYDNPWYPPWALVYARALPLVWGQIGLFALALLCLAAPFQVRRLRAALLSPQRRAAFALALAASVLFGAMFLRLPDESGYLVPVVAFVLLATALLASARASAALALALCLSSFIQIDRHGLRFDGPIIEDHAVRLSQLRATDAIIDAVRKLPGRAVVAVGWVLPRISLTLGGEALGAHRFIYLVEDSGDYEHYLAQGYSIYFLPGVDLYEAQAHELELAELGARPLDVPRELQRAYSTGE